MVDTVILAGDSASPMLNDAENKALLKINGKYMIDYIIDALRKSKDIGRIIVVGPEKELRLHIGDRVDAIVGDKGSIMNNLKAGVEYSGNRESVLACTCDIPLITPAAINDLVTRSRALKADISYPIIDKTVCLKKYPKAVRTYVKLKEGSFTGGNVFYINPLVIDLVYDLSSKLLDARKNPIKMARLMGFSFLLRLITGTLSIKNAESKVSGMFNIKAYAIISEYPEIGNDVDKQVDVEVAALYLNK
jgi:molybdopterin-guanine dinucleotide biosynthesis protein A